MKTLTNGMDFTMMSWSFECNDAMYKTESILATKGFTLYHVWQEQGGMPTAVLMMMPKVPRDLNMERCREGNAAIPAKKPIAETASMARFNGHPSIK